MLLAVGLLAAPSGWTARAGALTSVEPAAALEPAVALVVGLPRMRSLVVSVDGKRLAEQSFHGAAPHRAANLKSASKSIISVLIGIALDHGHLDGVGMTIDRFFPEYLNDRAKAPITVEHLLTMWSGLETTSNRNYGRWVQRRNLVRHVLARSPAGIWASRWGSRCPAGPPIHKGFASTATRCR